MPGIKYIPKPLVAWQFKPNDAAQKKELQSLGIQYNDDGTLIGPDGNPATPAEGDYIVQRGDDTITVQGKDYFESRYVKYS